MKNILSTALGTSTQNPRYWAIAAGTNGKVIDECLNDSIVAIGWDNLGDLSQIKTKERIDEIYEKKVRKPAKEHKNDTLALWQFAHVIAIGDKIILKSGTKTLLALGEVISEYFFDDSRPSYRHVRRVRWLHKTAVEVPKSITPPALKTLTDLSQYKDYPKKLESLLVTADVSGDELVIVGNIAWNPYQWMRPHRDPKSPFAYTNKNFGHESLNFDFNKKGLDTDSEINGYLRWTNAPKQLAPGGIAIFYSTDTETKEGKIVGIYGDIKINKDGRLTPWKGFEDNQLYTNIKARKDLSMLFPVYLSAQKYARGSRLVPQVGFTYKTTAFATRIVRDAIDAARKIEHTEEAVAKLERILQYIHGLGTKSHSASTGADPDGVQQLLLSKKQIILFGPPGTGKTYSTRNIAVDLIEAQ